MNTLVQYVLDHTERGECKCGRCCDVGNAPDPVSNHTIDMIFLIVSAKNDPAVEDFTKLTKAYHSDYGVDPLDGKEHNYMELGGWIGDQGSALQYMALGVSLGVFSLLTGKTILKLDQEASLALAGQGLLSIQLSKHKEAAK